MVCLYLEVNKLFGLVWLFSVCGRRFHGLIISGGSIIYSNALYRMSCTCSMTGILLSNHSFDPFFVLFVSAVYNDDVISTQSVVGVCYVCVIGNNTAEGYI